MRPGVTRTLARCAATAMVLIAARGDGRCAAAAPSPDRFELVRARIAAWAAGAPAERSTISATELKCRILDDWERQQARYQILSVRKPEDDSIAGHVPHAVNVYWPTILTAEGRARIDSTRTVIACCYFGHASMICSTVLGLLGCRCLSLEFGMMGWNGAALVKDPWDRIAEYPVETAPDRSRETYPLPVLTDVEPDATAIIRRRAAAYLEGEGSPIITAADLKALVDDWEHRRTEYQIVDVESRQSYARGHVPHALNVPLAQIAKVASLRRLDPGKTVITCSDNGQTGQRAATLLSLLGYRAVALKFGMMDWNSSCAPESRRWRDAAGFPVERGAVTEK